MINLPKIKFEPQSKANLTKKLAYQTKHSGCFDFYSDEENSIILNPGEQHAFKTGVYLNQEEKVAIYLFDQMHLNDLITAVLVLRPRSGLAAKFGIDVQAGEIDIDYPQEIRAILINLGKEPVRFWPGDRICQARWTLCLKAFGVETLETERTSGFGSTGSV